MNWDTDWLFNRARISPHAVAIVDGYTKESWTYSQLNERAEEIAGYLNEIGIAKGDRVAILSENHISYFDLFFACTKLGAIFVPLNWRLSDSEIKYIVQDCQPKLIAYHSNTNYRQEYRIPTLQVDGEEYLKILDTKMHFSKKDEVSIKDPSAIIYTGGTTGYPKGVVLTHLSIFTNIINTITSWQLTGDDVTCTFIPLFHTGGLNSLTMPILHLGGKVVIAREFEANHAIRILEDEKCTIVLFIPTMYHSMVQSPLFKVASFSSMKIFLSGGAPCSHKIYEAFEAKGAAFKEGYGLTEAGPNNFYMDLESVTKKRGSVGKPMLYNQVRVVRYDGSEADVNEVGEILLRGYHVFSNYWNQPEETSKAIKDGWLYTGDLGKRDIDGYYYIVGRKKDMIISGGENVYPQEVEHVISEHDAVDEVTVVGLPDEKWGEKVTAFVVLKEDTIVMADELKSFCRVKLGGYKVPKTIIFLDELPKTPVGKINKKELISAFSNVGEL